MFSDVALNPSENPHYHDKHYSLKDVPSKAGFTAVINNVTIGTISFILNIKKTLKN